MNGSKRKIDDFSVMGESWKLVPLKGQWYKTKKPYKNLVQDITNWIVFRNIRPVSSRVIKILPQREKTPKERTFLPEATAVEIKKRLQVLEELKRDNMISEKEYQQKRKEILEGF